MTWIVVLTAALAANCFAGWVFAGWRPDFGWTAEDLDHHPWSRSGRWQLRVRVGWWVQPVLKPRHWLDQWRGRISPYYQADADKLLLVVALPGFYPFLCSGERYGGWKPVFFPGPDFAPTIGLWWPAWLPVQHGFQFSLRG